MLIVDEQTKVLLENNYYCEYVGSACLDETFDCEKCNLFLEKIKEEV